jgi:hypothetical protein
MIRRFNYTGRRRIRRDDAKVSLRSDASFSVALQLDRYRLPDQARVFVEAYRPATSSYKRFDWGTVQEPKPASYRNLKEFGVPDGFLFRVKVVEDPKDSGPGRLLAGAERLRPQLIESSARRTLSLLDVIPSDELSEVWRIEFRENDDPVLLVNRKIVDSHQALVCSEAFAALVLPEVLRQILIRVLIVDKFAYHDDLSDWRGMWLSFCTRLPGLQQPPAPQVDNANSLENAEELEDWIDEAVAAFVRRFRVEEKFKDWWSEEGAE